MIIPIETPQMTTLIEASQMITLNCIFNGKVVLNPKHINFMRTSYSRSYKTRDAQTLVICFPPNKMPPNTTSKKASLRLSTTQIQQTVETNHESKPTTQLF